MRIAIYTLGCKVNQYETQAMEAELVRRGHTLIPFETEADAYIVNTCAVTATSGHKSRQIIRRAQKQNPAALVAVCGCYAQTDPKAVAEMGVDLISGPDRRMEFLDEVEKLWSDKASPRGETTAQMAVGNIMSTRVFEELPAGGLSGRTRAMLKVEDGCVNFCSYCIIPYARGPVRSLPLEKAVAEAKALADKGYKEIVLTGIEISSWGQDIGSPWAAGTVVWQSQMTCPQRQGSTLGLADLIEALCAAAPECRIRLGSLEPRTVTEDFCKRLSSLHNLCPHFHLSMQSGCDATLKRMNRKYDTARYYESVSLLRQWFDRPGITTDLIVGFPGETEEEFGQTLDFIQKCAFTAMHIFPYSRRPGTPADKMPDQIPNAEKEARAHRAAEMAAAMEQSYLQSWVGQTLPVLFEEPVKAKEPDHLWRGHAPNYVEIQAASVGSLHNIEKLVRITGTNGTSLMGEIVD